MTSVAIGGRVTDPNGSPISGATVAVSIHGVSYGSAFTGGPPYAGYYAWMTLTYTGNEWIVPCLMVVSCPGYATNSQTYLVFTGINGEANNSENFVLIPLGALTGIVFDATTKDPVGGAPVSAGQTEDTSRQFPPLVGKYSLEPLVAGPNTVTASHRGYDTVSKQIDILPGAELDYKPQVYNIPLTKPSCILTGTVLEEDGGGQLGQTQPVAATISISPAGLEGLSSFENGGVYKISGIPAGQPQTVTVSAYKHVTRKGTVTFSMPNQTINMDFGLYPIPYKPPRSPIGQPE